MGPSGDTSDLTRGLLRVPRNEDFRAHSAFFRSLLEHGVGGQADRVLEALRLQVLVHIREREGRIAAE